MLGADAPAFFEALSREPRRALRLFPGRGDRAAELEALAPFLGEAIPFAGDCFFLEEPGIGRHPLHHGGAVYVQDPAAMAPAAAVTVLPDDRVLDLCAAPGGKALAAGARLSPAGILVCNEPSPLRRRILLQNLERCGVGASVYGLDAARPLPPAWEEAFDLVICDAPCSGEGMFRKDEDAVRLWSPELVALSAERQRAILREAAKAVAPGGRLLYATCTWSVEENEAQIAGLLAARPDFSPAPLPAAVVAASSPGAALDGIDPARCRRFYPHVFPGEGQFLAVLRREGERPPREGAAFAPPPAKGDGALMAAFLEENLLTPPPGEWTERDGAWYLSPPPAFSRGAASPGVVLGEVKKGRVVPHHRLFLWREAAFRRTIDLSAEEAARYLAGEELPCDLPDGWAAARYLGCPLGGVKVSQGRAKNHYPKGLRRN